MLKESRALLMAWGTRSNLYMLIDIFAKSYVKQFVKFYLGSGRK